MRILGRIERGVVLVTVWALVLGTQVGEANAAVASQVPGSVWASSHSWPRPLAEVFLSMFRFLLESLWLA